MTVYLTKNSEEIRQQLMSAGFEVCACAKNDQTRWLVFRGFRNTVKNTVELKFHGAGIGCEYECKGMCFNKCILCELGDGINPHKTPCHDIKLFNDVNTMLEYINSNKEELIITL